MTLQVVNKIVTGPYGTIFNNENIFIDKEGGGAGNNVRPGTWLGPTTKANRVYAPASGQQDMRQENESTKM